MTVYFRYKWLEIVLYLTMGLCPSISILSMVSGLSLYYSYTYVCKLPSWRA